MPWYSFCINDEPAQPDLASGYIEAPTIREAVRRLRDDRANVYELPDGWTPGPRDLPLCR